MPSPTNASIAVDGTRLNVFYANFSQLYSHSESPRRNMEFTVELNDQANLPFAALRKLFDLADYLNNDKVRDFTLELWKDEKKQEPVCTFTFKSRITLFEITSCDGSHRLKVGIDPIIDPKSAPLLAG